MKYERTKTTWTCGGWKGRKGNEQEEENRREKVFYSLQK